MTGPRLVRAARTAAYTALALVALAVGAALVLPAFLDTQRVGAEIQEKLSQAVHGEVTWEKLAIRLLPSPRGALTQVRVEIPETASVRAAEVDVLLRLLPLLRGRAEVASLHLSKPEIRLEIAPSRPTDKTPTEASPDPMDAYRSAIAAIHRFAPNSVLDIEDANLDVSIPGLPPIRLRRLEMSARTGEDLEIEITAESEYWKRMKLSAKVAFVDGSGTARIEAAEAKPQVWLDHFLAKSPVSVALPAAALSAEARTDGREKLECDFSLGAPSVEVVRAAQRLPVPDVALSGTVAIDAGELALRLKEARLGASRLTEGSLRYSPKGDTLAALAQYDLDLAQAMDGVRRMLAEEAGEALAPIQSVTGRAQGRVKVASAPKGWSALAEIKQSDASVGIKGAPGPARLASASVEVTRGAVKIDRASLSMLDASATASANIAYGDRLQIQGGVSEGSVGENTLAWIWKSAELPPRLALKAPVRIAVQRAVWSPKRPLDLQATAQFDSRTSVAVDLGWTPEELDVRRAAIKDARSDAAIALRTKASLIEGKFSGSLSSASLAAALKGAKLPSGGASGELRFNFDRQHPERISAEGKLKGEAIDLAWLLDRPVRIDSADLEAGPGGVRVRAADLNWAEQRFKLRGGARHGPAGPLIDAQVESPGVLLDALFPAPGKKPEAAGKEAKEETPKIWPLPVAGRIALRADFVQSGRYKVSPFEAALALEREQAHLELQKARLCGISMPLTVEATPEGLAVEAHVAAQKQQLEETARCLTERGVQMSGTFDLTADLRTRGKVDELQRNLQGTVRAEARDGRVMKFALLGNILSFKGVADLLKEGEAKVDSAGFPYRSLSAAGRLEAGRFIVDESAFDSSAVGLAANGWISIVDYQSKLAVLVAPFARVDRLARSVPLLGYVLGGALTSIPVGVSGDIRDPLVVPLGPSAVTSELKGIFERTIKLPEKLVPPQLKP